MQIKLFDLKEEMLRNEEYFIDFLENNFQVNYGDSNLIIQKVFLLQERHLCRMDLICYEAYGNINNIDGLMKFNGITNPFSMEVHDLILAPSMKSLDGFYQKEVKQSKITLNTKALFLDPTRASQKDLERLKQLQKIASKKKNGATEIMPTNLLRKNEKAFTTDGDVLIFAPSITKPRQ